MMKGDKDEEKIMGPLFPRLHISDAEKEGPRAPPRNKMALYKQLGIPSQKFTSGSSSMLPLLAHNSGSSALSTSTSHGGAKRRSLLSPFCNSPVSSHSAERLQSYSSVGMNSNTSSMKLEWQPKPTNCSAAGHMQMTAHCSFLQPHSTSHSKNSSAKKPGDYRDFRVPTIDQTGRSLTCGGGPKNMDQEKLTASSPNRKLQVAFAKQIKQSSTADLMSRQHWKNHTQGNSEMSRSVEDYAEKPASILTNGNKVLADASPLATGGFFDSVKVELVPLQKEKRSSLVDDSSRSPDPNERLHHECRTSQEKKALRDGVSAELKTTTRKRNPSTLEAVSCCSPPPGNNDRFVDRLENVSECPEDQSGPLQVGARELDRNADVSDNSIVDSISGDDIYPDEVVRVIGQKQFWKARRSIVHQQRVFAVQVFELHRLIMVQRLLAASPDLLLGKRLHKRKHSVEVLLPLKKLPSENVLEAPTSMVKQKDYPHKLVHDTECAAESVLGKPPLPFPNSDINKGLDAPHSNYKPSTASPPPAPATTDAKPAPWCFHLPPGNHWLVPIMSPSEGLVYKPYTGPCPPTTGFMAPVYGSRGAMSTISVGGDFLNTAYGIPASHQGIGILPRTTPLGLTYFPHYGMPLVNPSVSGSAVEQVSSLARAWSNGQDNNLMAGMNFSTFYPSSWTMSSQTNGVNSCSVKNLPELKESRQGSNSESSPSEKEQGDALPLFHTASAVQVSDQHAQIHSSEQRTRVIRVVPHNPKSAAESAARIFRYIQEERRKETV